MPKVTIWIFDDMDGAFPLDAEIKRDGEHIVLENRTIKIKILIDTVRMIIDGDDGHG